VFADLMKPGCSVDFGYLDSNTFQWPQVNITAGTQVLISIVDQNDDEGWSGVVSGENVFPPVHSLMLFPSRSPSGRAVTAPA
jgi:hypothetical protein